MVDYLIAIQYPSGRIEYGFWRFEAREITLERVVRLAARSAGGGVVSAVYVKQYEFTEEETDHAES
jgi:hypothetical protein